MGHGHLSHVVIRHTQWLIVVSISYVGRQRVWVFSLLFLSHPMPFDENSWFGLFRPLCRPA